MCNEFNFIFKDPLFRDPVPINYLSYVGTVNKLNQVEKNKPNRKQFIDNVNSLFDGLKKYVEKSIDETADDFGIEFVSGRLAPIKKDDEETEDKKEGIIN